MKNAVSLQYPYVAEIKHLASSDRMVPFKWAEESFGTWADMLDEKNLRWFVNFEADKDRYFFKDQEQFVLFSLKWAS